jgi:hypothetical protein
VSAGSSSPGIKSEKSMSIGFICFSLSELATLFE